jgi:hypothetical protein
MTNCEKYDGPERTLALVELTLHSERVATRPATTVGNAASFALAMITGKFVEDQTVIEARRRTCETCEYRRIDKTGQGFCSLCGCSVNAESKRITNLAAYEENLPAWGCKHPQRSEGKGWTV